jgi:hypothetical protein
MDLGEQQIPGSHIVFGQLRLESQVQITLRPQMFMSVFTHFQSVYSSTQLLWFVSLTWATFMYGQNILRILKFNSQDYENLFKLLVNVLSFYIFLKNALPLLWTRQQIRCAYSIIISLQSFPNHWPIKTWNNQHFVYSFCSTSHIWCITNISEIV